MTPPINTETGNNVNKDNKDNIHLNVLKDTKRSYEAEIDVLRRTIEDGSDHFG